MDPTGEEQLDYGDDDFAIPAVADEEIDDDFDDLYNYANVARAVSLKPAPHPVGSGSGLPPPPNPYPKLEPPPFPTAPRFSIPFVGADRNPNPNTNPRFLEQLRFGPPTTLFVGELLWWTTDEEIESAASRYGRVKEVKFFDERPSGRSKGYCQVEFCDAASAAAGGGVGAGGPHGQGLAGPAVGGLMHQQGSTGADFKDMMARFQAMNVVGLPGVAPRGNPSLFGRGTAANAMGGSGMEGQMWGDASMGGGWTAEEHGRRMARESSYGGDDGSSGFGYGDERGGRSRLLGPHERMVMTRDARPF